MLVHCDGGYTWLVLGKTIVCIERRRMAPAHRTRRAGLLDVLRAWGWLRWPAGEA